MDLTRAHIEFAFFLDKRATSQVPEMPPEVVDLLLNEAIDRFMKTRYGGNNIYQTSAEETQKRKDDLRMLLKTVEVSMSLVATEDNTYRVALTSISDYRFLARLRTHVVFGNCEAWVGKINLVQQDDLEVAKLDPFNETVVEEPLAYFEEGDIFVLGTDTITYDLAKVTYYKQPAKVDILAVPIVEFDMPEHTHKEIIQIAVDIALETIESQRGQTIKSQLNTIE